MSSGKVTLKGILKSKDVTDLAVKELFTNDKGKIEIVCSNLRVNFNFRCL